MLIINAYVHSTYFDFSKQNLDLFSGMALLTHLKCLTEMYQDEGNGLRTLQLRILFLFSSSVIKNID